MTDSFLQLCGNVIDLQFKWQRRSPHFSLFKWHNYIYFIFSWIPHCTTARVDRFVLKSERFSSVGCGRASNRCFSTVSLHIWSGYIWGVWSFSKESRGSCCLARGYGSTAPWSCLRSGMLRNYILVCFVITIIWRHIENRQTLQLMMIWKLS